MIALVQVVADHSGDPRRDDLGRNTGYVREKPTTTRALALLALLIEGCAALLNPALVDYTPIARPPHRLEPRAPDRVEVLVRPPARPHVEIGLLEASEETPPPDQKRSSAGTARLTQALRAKAATLGCDALVVEYLVVRTRLHGVCVVYDSPPPGHDGADQGRDSIEALLSRAAVEEGHGRVAESVRLYQEALARLPAADPRAEVVRRRLEALKAKRAHLTMRLPREAPTQTLVGIDDKRVEVSSAGTTVAVDPGKHLVWVQGPGSVRRYETVRVVAGERRELWLSGKPYGDVLVDVHAQRVERRTVGLVFAGIAVASLTAAVITGIEVSSAHDTVDQECPNRVCTSKGWDAVRSGRTLLIANGIAWGVGAAAAAASTWMLWPRHAQERPSVTLDVSPSSAGAWVSVRGRF